MQSQRSKPTSAVGHFWHYTRSLLGLYKVSFKVNAASQVEEEEEDGTLRDRAMPT